MKKETIEERLRQEFSGIAPNRLDELLAAVDELHDADNSVIDFRQESRKRRFGVKTVLSAAAALLLVVGAAGAYGSFSASKYIVSVDVNPSVELTVNGFNTVKEVTLNNDDAKALIDAEALEGRSISNAMDALTEKLCGDGYLTKDCNGILVSVRNLKGGSSDALCMKIISSVEEATSRAGFNYAVLYQELDGEKSDCSGKSELAEKLSGSLDAFDADELESSSVQDLIFLADSLDTLPDKTELFGRLNGFRSALDARLIAAEAAAGLEGGSSSHSIVRYAEQLAYEVVFKDGKTTHKYFVSATTGDVLAHETDGGSGTGTSRPAGSSDESILSPDEALSIFRKANGLMSAVLDDLTISRSTRNGEPAYIVKFKLFGIPRTAVLDARTARAISDIDF